MVELLIHRYFNDLEMISIGSILKRKRQSLRMIPYWNFKNSNEGLRNEEESEKI
jgi:hypothetical protein